MSTEDSDYEEFIHDLNNMYDTMREFSEKWEGKENKIKITKEEYLKLLMIMDQHDAWYEHSMGETD